MSMEKKRVTMIGGIFFKASNGEKLKSWYSRHLGLDTDKYGASLKFHPLGKNSNGYLQWSTFEENTQYFSPSTKEFMINYRVEDLEWLVDQLRKEGVPILDEIAIYEYGKFVHILDPEGNKIELWEPIDEVFDRLDDS